MNPASLRYLMSAAAAKIGGRAIACPACGHSNTECIARKHLVTELHRCELCQLLFRAPTMTAETSREFYQDAYSQGFTTDLPDEATLELLLAGKFRSTEKDYSPYVSILTSLRVPAGARLFDFGCSWGYGTWQLKAHGFDVQAFEISSPRACFARERLGLDVHDSLPPPTPSFDVFFSAHVLEHVPSVTESIDYGFSMLKPGGLFIAFTPNGSEAFRRARPWNWMKAWGLVHPNLLDDRYYQTVCANRRHLITSSPYATRELGQWRAGSINRTVGDLAGDELCFAAVAA